ncbi:hypothetical protein [Amphibacillus xylanus]|nr:hypothetical protein [Amphibacillus xylanus]
MIRGVVEMQMVLPASYAVIEEEMMYLDGGVGIPNWTVSAVINIGIAKLTGGGTIRLLAKFIKRNGSAAARREFNKVLVRFVSTKVANTVTGLVLGAINGFLSFSVGAALTTIWDRRDNKPNNGYLNAIW